MNPPGNDVYTYFTDHDGQLWRIQDLNFQQQPVITTKEKVLSFVVVVLIILKVLILLGIVVMLSVSTHEHPNKPLRVWLGVVLGLWVLAELMNFYPRSISSFSITGDAGSIGWSSESGGRPCFLWTLRLASLSWYIVGLYWSISGGEKLMNGAPRLFWTTTSVLGVGAVIAALFCCILGLMYCWLCCKAAAGFFKRGIAEQPESRL